MGLKKESFKELKTILTASGLHSYQEIFDMLLREKLANLEMTKEDEIKFITNLFS